MAFPSNSFFPGYANFQPANPSFGNGLSHVVADTSTVRSFIPQPTVFSDIDGIPLNMNVPHRLNASSKTEGGDGRRQAKEGSERKEEKRKGSESRYWTKQEKEKFNVALKMFGTDFEAIANFVGTRNSTQVRTHAQKYYAKLVRDYKKSGKSSSRLSNARYS